eukprot:gene8470-biopygen3061
MPQSRHDHAHAPARGCRPRCWSPPPSTTSPSPMPQEGSARSGPSSPESIGTSESSPVLRCSPARWCSPRCCAGAVSITR